MKPLFTLFWQLCRFRSGPEDVPYAPGLAALLLLAVLAMGLLSIPLLGQLETAAQDAATTAGAPATDSAATGTAPTDSTATDSTAPAQALPPGLQALVQSLIVAGWLLAIYGLLRFKNLQSRYTQTITSALGTDLIMGLPQILLFAIMIVNPAESVVAAAARMILLGVYVWDMLIKGHIYSRAMNISRLQGNLLSVSLSIGLYLTSALLFTPPSP